MSTVESDGFVIESSNPDADAVRASLDIGASPPTSEAVARPAAPDPEPSADGAADNGEAAATETAETPESGRERGADGKFAKKGSIQDRINKAVYEREEAKRERDAMAARLSQLEQARAPQPQVDEPREENQPAPQENPRDWELPPPPPGRVSWSGRAEPDPNAYATYELGVKAVARWEAGEVFAYETIQRETQQEFQRAVISHTERIQSFAAKTPDYFEKIQAAAKLPCPPIMENAIIASARGPEIAYFLATHPEEAIQMAYDALEVEGPSAPKIVRRMLEAHLHAQPTASTGPVAGGYRPNVSAPIKPVGSAPVASETSPDTLPFDKYVEHMNALERKKAARGY